ncbi:MAG: avidin/streptavidin family protein [Acidobacteriota bacterium]
MNWLPLLVMLATPVTPCLGPSAWDNDGGSTLHIDSIAADGQISGHYVNHAQGYRCQGTAYPVTGWWALDTNVVTFSVKWQNDHERCNSVTSWVGYFEAGCKRLVTSWFLVRDDADNRDDMLSGESVFIRIAP